MRRLYALMRELLLKNRKAAVTNQVTNITGRMLFVIGNAAGLALGAYLFRSGSITIGTVYLISYYIGLLTMPLEQITRQLQDLQKAGASIARVQEISHIQSAIRNGSTSIAQASALEVEFAGVSFEYEDGDGGREMEDGEDAPSASPDPASPAPVLSNISFPLAPGRVLGLLGRTGSGKTTLTRLLFRLYDPTAGAIRLGGVDLRAARIHDIRERVGMVTQDVQLFRASIRDNLTFFNPYISDQQILAAIEELGLWEWYQALPEGLDTLLAASGGLSAGEAQILAFARVFLKDPGLVILDEASSRLDPATERLIERAIERLLAGRTGIIIAHRLHTVQRADEILILERGRICEHGRRERLIGDTDSRFAQLLKTGLEEALV
jgi:ABC-type multidrug transport system fused ATPase/permease subunit